ncbi:MAG: hypothetical protein IPH59_17105 [bacterium]|nr:hypothetical protein [bacterium]
MLMLFQQVRIAVWMGWINQRTVNAIVHRVATAAIGYAAIMKCECCAGKQRQKRERHNK